MWEIFETNIRETEMKRRVSEKTSAENKRTERNLLAINTERKHVVSTQTREPRNHVGNIIDGDPIQVLLLTECNASIIRWDLTCPSPAGVSLQSIIQWGLYLEPSRVYTLTLKSCITRVHLVFECGCNFVTASICAIIDLYLSGRQMEPRESTFEPSQVWDKSQSHFNERSTDTLCIRPLAIIILVTWLYFILSLEIGSVQHCLITLLYILDFVSFIHLIQYLELNEYSFSQTL